MDGGNVGGQLGADTMVVGGVLKNATVSMTKVSDPENSGDLADSLTVGGCVSNSTVYAGAGADFMSVDGAMIAGEFYGGSGADSVLGGSLGGVIELSEGADSLPLRQTPQLFWRNENDTFSFAGAVRDSSLVGGFGGQHHRDRSAAWFDGLGWRPVGWW